jgi:hypothetical protein
VSQAIPETSTQPPLENGAGPTRDETPLTLPTWQAQEILNYLGQCPAGQVYPLLGYLLTAGTAAEKA